VLVGGERKVTHEQLASHLSHSLSCGAHRASLPEPDAVRDEGRDRDQLGRPTAAMQHESNGSSIRAEAVASGVLDYDVER
jgi:hypothetical protein